jgi:hypothetical protein
MNDIKYCSRCPPRSRQAEVPRTTATVMPAASRRHQNAWARPAGGKVAPANCASLPFVRSCYFGAPDLSASVFTGLDMSIDDERKGAERARDVLSTLSRSAAYADHIVHPLRLAAGLATTASSQGFSSQAELNNIRSDATEAFNAVIRALQTRTLTNSIIASAQTGVAAWLRALEAA